MKTSKRYRNHPAADIFPLMGDAEYERLKADIAARGQSTAIDIFEDQILDGRNRYRACMELGIDPAAWLGLRLRRWRFCDRRCARLRYAI